MPTSVRRDPQSSAERRRIGLALIVALFLHVPIFLAPGAWRFGSLDDAKAPPLEVRIELLEGNNTKEDVQPDAPPQVAAAAPGPRDVPEPSDTESNQVRVQGADERIADLEPLSDVPEIPASDQSPAPIDATFAGADLALDALASAVPELANSAPGEPTRAEAELTDEPGAPAEAVLATIAPAQERALTRRLTREAHDLLGSGASERQVTFENDDREFAAVLTREMASDGTGIERVTVEVTTEHGGERARTRMQMKRLAFSHFTQLVDRWDPEVALHDDEIAGRFHSNSVINLSYDRKVAPRLLGKVSTARGIRIAEGEGQRWRQHVPHRRIFVGGLETRVARIALPEISLAVARRHTAGDADVHVVRTDALIIFHADGGYECVELESRVATRRQLARGRPTYIIGVPDAELRVRGVVDGNVTLYSPQRIVVQGTLRYAQGLRAGADDYLGLVSDGNVEIDSADVTGPGDLEINAAVYARKRFVVRNTNARGGGTLFMYGSLTAGSLSETEPRYATRIEFDPRFEHTRPPGFPETDRYEIEDWDRRWEVTDGLAPRS